MNKNQIPDYLTEDEADEIAREFFRETFYQHEDDELEQQFFGSIQPRLSEMDEELIRLASHPVDGAGEFYPEHTIVVDVNNRKLAVRLLSILDDMPCAPSRMKTFDAPRGKEATLFPYLSRLMSPARGIAAVATAWIDTPIQQSSRARQTALMELNWLMQKDMQIIDLNWPYHDTVRLYFSILDQVFFAGMLEKHVEVHQVPFHGEFLNKYGLWGLTRPAQNDDPKVRIAMQNMATVEADDPRKKQWMWMSILLHEMVHAILSVYGCDCKPCSDRHVGVSWHGVAWQSIAISVNACLRQNVICRIPPADWLPMWEPDDLNICQSSLPEKSRDPLYCRFVPDEDRQASEE